VKKKKGKKKGEKKASFLSLAFCCSLSHCPSVSEEGRKKRKGEKGREEKSTGSALSSSRFPVLPLVCAE